MNLPAEVRYLPENTFILGLIPPPASPDPVTISNILQPLIEKFLELQNPGINISTYHHPEGVPVQT